MDPYSHEAYLAWWRQNGGEKPDYTLARHFENGIRALSPRAFRGKTPEEIFDFLTSRFGPLLAAEAFRRVLNGLRDDRPE